MNYIELACPKPIDNIQAEILIAELAEIGFESFSEEEEKLLAYIQQPDFSQEKLLTIELIKKVEDQINIQVIEDQNWNAVWESNYPPVTISGKCQVRAPFHEKNENLSFDILLNPKMAFGTAHHETTALMIEYLLEEDCEGKAVLDMGCGTAVLAILASLKGAQKVMAIDNDVWAYQNSIENIGLNHCSNIEPLLGDASILESKPTYEVILANINKNILLCDIKNYGTTLKKDGRLFLSGFYTEDLEDIKKEAANIGLKFVNHKIKNNWVAAAFELTI